MTYSINMGDIALDLACLEKWIKYDNTNPYLFDP